MDTAELKEELLREAVEDHRGLWILPWELREVLGIEDPEERRRMTLRMVSDLLGAGLIRAGFPRDRLGFEPWTLTAEEAVARIDREWRALGREPDIGEIVWFDITEKGREHVGA